MATTLDPEATARAAQQLLHNRIDAVRALVDARAAVEQARAQLTAAEQADVRAYKAATTAGWTVDELRQLELPEPGKVARVRRKRATAQQTERPAANENHNPG